MKEVASTRTPFDRSAFLILLVLLTLGLAWVVWPVFGAVLWGAILAILFTPLDRWFLAAMKGWRNLAALLTLIVILLIVVLPLALVTVSLVQDATALYERVRSGQINFGIDLLQIIEALPSWVVRLLERLGINDVVELQSRVAAAIAQRAQTIAGQTFYVGQYTLDLLVSFVIAMYLLFFLLRDGAAVAREIQTSIPLAPDIKSRLLARFTTVIRATVKGNVLVAAAQGALGGLAFWALGVPGPILWAVIMAFLSLLPAVGAALIWGPVALYLLATGELWQGIGLIAFGIFAIGLVDNLLRPILVGKDIHLPDYVVLISTIGGLSVFGISGFVLGPLIVAMCFSAWQIFVSERTQAEAHTAL